MSWKNTEIMEIKIVVLSLEFLYSVYDGSNISGYAIILDLYSRNKWCQILLAKTDRITKLSLLSEIVIPTYSSQLFIDEEKKQKCWLNTHKKECITL